MKKKKKNLSYLSFQSLCGPEQKERMRVLLKIRAEKKKKKSLNLLSRDAKNFYLLLKKGGSRIFCIAFLTESTKQDTSLTEKYNVVFAYRS